MGGLDSLGINMPTLLAQLVNVIVLLDCSTWWLISP